MFEVLAHIAHTGSCEDEELIAPERKFAHALPSLVHIPYSKLVRHKSAFLALGLLIVLLVSPSVRANVSIEYLGPYPLNPIAVPGLDRTLSGSFTVGNVGSEQMIINMAVSSNDPDFEPHFTVTFSDNQFALEPGARREVTARFVFDGGTPEHSYSAQIEIVASAAHYPEGSNPGRATFDLPVEIFSDLPPPTITTTTTTASGQCTLDASACIQVSAGTSSGLTAVPVSSIPIPPPAAAGTFPQGLFSFTVSGLSPRQTVIVTITLSSPLPAGAFSYWKFEGGAWAQFPSAWLDPTRRIITLAFIVPAGSTSISDPGGPAIIPQVTTTTQTRTSQTTTHSSTTTRTTTHSSTTTHTSSTTAQSPLMYITVVTSPLAFGNPQGGGTYPVGSVITISVDNVPGYTFTKWQRDGEDYTSQQSFTYTVDASRTFTAIFQAASSISLIDVTITSAPAGLAVVVDGTLVTTPQVFTWESGSVHTISANGPVSQANGVQYVWVSWSDGGEQSHTVAPSASTTYTANFELQAQTATSQVTTPTSPPAGQLSTNPSPRCIIATAAYGSEMAPEVAYMRHVRDNLIGSTPTGKTLRDAFNAFYYSWSPPVAAAIAHSSNLQAPFRILLLPIVATVHATAWVFTKLGSTDFASVVAFGVAAVLCVSTYIVLPVLAIRGAWKRIRPRT